MEFRIADTFTASLARLTADEQKAAKTTAFDLQLNPANPGIQLHRIDQSKDKNFWSARISRDLRLVLYRTASSMLLCYADHHDAAYQWAERRVIEPHPRTGAAQIVEVRETVREIDVPRYVTGERTVAEPAPPPVPRPRLLDHVTDDDLLGYGVPPEWLADARAATEDTLFELTDHLPGEAAEALLELATGGTPTPPVQAAERRGPLRAPRRAASLPGHGQRRESGASPRLPVGAVDGPSSTHPSGTSSSVATTARPASPGPPARVRPSSRCTARSTSRARIPRLAPCSPRSATPSRRRCG